jgi:hypothetical protein
MSICLQLLFCDILQLWAFFIDIDEGIDVFDQSPFLTL